MECGNRLRVGVRAQNDTVPSKVQTFSSGQKEKNDNLKLLGPDIFGWGGSLPRAGVGAKSS